MNSPEKNKGRVNKMVYQFNAGHGAGRGAGRGDGRGRGRNQVYRKVDIAPKATLMLLDQDNLNKKRLNENAEELIKWIKGRQ